MKEWINKYSNVSSRELAKLSGMSRNTINKWKIIKKKINYK